MLERIDIFIKSIAAVIAGITSLMIGYFGIIFSVLLIFMVLDFISGLLVAIYERKLNSRIGTKGLVKKVYIILLILSTYLIEVALLNSNGVIADGLSGAFLTFEFLSIVENSGRLNLPLPNKLKEIVATLKSKGDPQ